MADDTATINTADADANADSEISTDGSGDTIATGVDTNSDSGTQEGSGGEEPAPVDYSKLDAPDSFKSREGYLDTIKEFAETNGLSAEAAQKLIDREVDAASKAESAFEQTFQQEQREWVETAKSDKEIGGDNFDQSKQMARKVINRFASDELVEELKATGLGNHPELVRLLVRIGKTMSDDTLITGSVTAPGNQSERSAEDVFYPDQK